MPWFSGSIPQAIEKSRSNGAYFVVYVRGSDEDQKSQEFTKLLETTSLSQLLDSHKFVKIQLVLGSQECNQFSQIYPVILVPSMYFIDLQGTPVEVIAGNVSVDTFKEKLEKLIGIGKSEHQDGAGSSAPEESVKVSEAEKPLKPEEVEPQPESSKEESLGNQQSSDTGEPSRSEDSEPAVDGTQEAPALVEGAHEDTSERQPSLEEKLEKARQLTEALRVKKEKEEREKERRQEIERRETLKSLQKFKQEQEEREMKELAEQRRKEKEADRLAREKVRKQIEQDRLDKAAKFNAEKSEALAQKDEAKKLAEQQTKATTVAAARSENARIQFRFPDGSTLVEVFPAVSTFAELRTFLESQPDLPFRNFRLTTTMPRREFGPEDSSKTLRDLELAPSAAILVIPNHAMVQSHGSGISSWIQLILAPFFTLFGYIKFFLFGSATPQRTESASPPAKKAKNGQSTAGGAGTSRDEVEDSDGNLRRRNIGPSSTIKRDGNVHRFIDKKDDDDENNTWNGNSTQQM